MTATARVPLRGSLLVTLVTRQRKAVRLLIPFLGLIFLASAWLGSLTRGLVDHALVAQGQPAWPFMTNIMVWAGVLALASGVCFVVARRVGYHMEFEARVWLHTRLQAADLQRIDAAVGGELVTQAVVDLSAVERVAAVLPALVVSGAMFAGLGFFAFRTSQLLAIAGGCAIYLNVGALWLLRRRLAARSAGELNARNDVTAAVDEMAHGIGVVHAFAYAQREEARVREAAVRALGAAGPRARAMARLDFFSKLVPFLTQALLLFVGAHLMAGSDWLLSGKVTTGSFVVAFQESLLAAVLTVCIDEFVAAWPVLASAQDRISRLLAVGSMPPSARATLPQTSSTGLDMQGVTIEMGDRRTARSLDLRVAPGELVIVTVPEDCALPRLAETAAGLVRAERGAVLLDGIAIEELGASERHEGIRLLSAAPLFVEATLRDNLLLGASSDFTDDALAAALAAVGADALGAAGLDSQVGGSGSATSAGHGQRLALARALVEEPRLLVLDDALSALAVEEMANTLARVREYAPRMAVLLIVRGPDPGFGDRTVVLDRGATHDANGAEPTSVESHALESHADDDASADRDDDPRHARAVEDAHGPRLRGALRPFLPLVLLAAPALVITAVFQQSTALLFGWFADSSHEGVSRMDGWALALIGIGLVYASASAVSRIVVHRACQGVVSITRRMVFAELRAVGARWMQLGAARPVAARAARDAEGTAPFSAGSGYLLLTGAIGIAVAALTIILISADLAPLVLGLLATVLAVGSVLYAIARRAASWSQEELDATDAALEQDLAARREIRALGAQQAHTDRFVQASWQRLQARWWLTIIGGVFTVAVQFVGVVFAPLVLWRASELHNTGALGVAGALSAGALAWVVALQLLLAGTSAPDFVEARVARKRLRELVGTATTNADGSAGTDCPPLLGDVVFRNVQIEIPGSGGEILDLSFTAPAGSISVVTGRRGSGKSNVARLLARSMTPEAGTITIGGRDVNDLALAGYRSRIGVVAQDAFLFRGTVASNIAFGRPHAGERDVEAAARDVGAHEVIAALPDGYHQRVERGGVNLTPGQRHLVALARARLTRPDVLVLDETLRFLDLETEQRVLDALAHLDCTTVITTAREDLRIPGAVVMMLERGRVST